MKLEMQIDDQVAEVEDDEDEEPLSTGTGAHFRKCTPFDALQRRAERRSVSVETEAHLCASCHLGHTQTTQHRNRGRPTREAPPTGSTGVLGGTRQRRNEGRTSVAPVTSSVDALPGPSRVEK